MRNGREYEILLMISGAVNRGCDQETMRERVTYDGKRDVEGIG